MPNWSQGGPFEWQVPNSSEPGQPDGYNAIIQPGFRDETLFADIVRVIRNLYRCHNWHKCLHADLLDGYHADEMIGVNVEKNSANSVGLQQTLNFIEGANVTITVAEDATNERINVTIAASSSVSFPLEAPDNSTSPQYSFDAGTVAGSDLAGMGFDQDTQEGPKLTDITGAARLIVSTTGIEIPDKLTVGGLIDPTGLELTPVAANPGGTAANTLWLDSTASNKLKWGADLLMKGSTGSTDNAVLRADGTGGNTTQASEITVSDLSGGAATISTVTAATALTVRPLVSGIGNPGGDLTLSGGNAGLGGTGGTAIITGGSGSGGNGNVTIGATNTSAVNIGVSTLTTTIAGTLAVSESVIFSGDGSGAAGNDVNPGSVARYRLTSGATHTGFTGGTDGRLLIVENATGGTVTVSHDATSTAANRIYCPGSTNLTVPANGTIVLCYSGTDSRWRVASIASGSSVSTASTTEVLTGTDTAKAVTPDALAALWEKGSDIASAGTISVGEGGYFDVTGTTTITDIDFATDKAGRVAVLKFEGVLTLTHSATLILPNGTNITTADGDVAVFVSDGAADTVRMIDYFPVSAELFKVLSANDTGGNVNTAQPWFPTAGAVTVAASTTYFFEGLLHLSRSAGTTSHTTSLLFGGTASITSIRYEAIVNSGQTAANENRNGTMIGVATATVVKAASTTATEQVCIEVMGTVRVNAGGTLIPQFQYSAAPGGAPTVLADSFFRLKRIGSNTVTVQGTWA